MKEHVFRTLFFCFLTALSLTLCAWAADVVDSGTCGENLTWTLDSDGVLTISGKGAMDDLHSVGDSPWYEKRNSIVAVIINDGVTTIGWGAFGDCESLTSVTIPDSVASIGDAAFWTCANLMSVTIPESVISIGDGAFSYCKNLTNVLVHSGNRNYMSVNGILFNKSLTSLICYPSGKTGAYTIPDSVTSIGNDAFQGCYGLTSVTIPDSVTYIGDYTFKGCALTSVTIPDSVASIGNAAFSDCRSLTSVTIPDSVTYIGNSAFLGCDSLTSVTIPDSVTYIGDGAFLNCDSLTSVTIPNSVTYINSSVFPYCKSLTSVTIPDSVTYIGNWAFLGCDSLTSVTIPDSVTSIGYGAFSGCESLVDVYYGGSATQWKEIRISDKNDALKNATIRYDAKDLGVGITLTDESGKNVDGNGQTVEGEGENETKKDAFQDGAEFKATFDAVEPDAASGLVSASVFIIFYDKDGLMVSLESKEIDLSDPFNLMFVLDIRIPDGAKTLKFLMLGDGFEPLRAARMIESSSDG